jgi:TPR repeat protein
MSQATLGRWLKNGVHYKKDELLGFKWLQRGAIAGSSEAQEQLAYCYMNGIGTPKSQTEAFYWFQRAAAAGHGGALCMIGALAADGDLPEKGDEYAVKQFEAAYFSGYTRAAMHLGDFYLENRSLYNPKIAFYWCKKAAKAGIPEGWYSIAQAIRQGQGKFDALEDARYTMALAADMGFAPAVYGLGEMYERGEYGSVDRKAAVDAYKYAAAMASADEKTKLLARQGITRLNRSWLW